MQDLKTIRQIWAMRDWPIYGALTLWDWRRPEYTVLSVLSTPKERQTRFVQGLIVFRKIGEIESWSWNFVWISLLYKKDIFLLFPFFFFKSTYLFHCILNGFWPFCSRCPLKSYLYCHLGHTATNLTKQMDQMG